MKLFLAVFGVLLTGISVLFAQKPAIPLDETTKKAVYTEVVQAEGITQADLYNRALAWFKSYFPNPASVIKVQDPTTGVVSGQHGIYFYKTLEDGKEFKVGQVRYTVEVLVKEGRYKFTIDDIFKLESPKVYLEEWLDESDPDKVNRFNYASQMDKNMQELIAKLKIAMKTGKQAEKEDW
ncbi:MAG: DUF4468 domain-containing protein [Chitinophagales bacterium]|nr:DUF4468 domain-containing protein [Chitinophagales bacterium]